MIAVAPALEDLLMQDVTATTFAQVFGWALGYRDIARAALADLHDRDVRIGVLTQENSALRTELRDERRRVGEAVA